MTALPYIEAPAGEKAIELQSLHVEALISGLYAETSQTMVFFNPNRRPLEGNLDLPLTRWGRGQWLRSRY